MTQDHLIVLYIESIDDSAPRPDPDDDMAYAAATAFAHMVDEVATVEDLAAYRTWMTYCRLRGDDEHALRGAVSVSEHWGRVLGVDQ